MRATLRRRSPWKLAGADLKVRPYGIDTRYCTTTWPTKILRDQFVSQA